MTGLRLTIVSLLALASCSQGAQNPAPNEPVNATDANAVEPSVNQAEAPEDRIPLNEPKGPIDPKSAEAAGQVVQSFGALIEQKRWAEAEKLWGDAGAASALTEDLKRRSEAHLEIGDLGAPEGAAGSIYVTMPVVFYGKNDSGTDFRRPAEVVLRRVNDVPGSTEAQRRWHIERVDWKG